MACSTKPSPARIVNFVDEEVGVTVTQDEWHAMRVLAVREEGGTGSRRVATPEEVTESLVSFTNVIASDLGYNTSPEEDDYGNRASVLIPDFYGEWLNPSDEELDNITASGHADYYEKCIEFEKSMKSMKVTKGTCEVMNYISEFGIEQALEQAREEIKNQKKNKKSQAA